MKTKLHVYIVMQCSDNNKNLEERIVEVFLQRELAENKRESLQRKSPDVYYAVIKRSLKGAKCNALRDTYNGL